MRMKKNRRDGMQFPVYIAAVILAGVLFLLWGQSNSAATVYELGFLRYRAGVQLASVSEWAVTEEEQAALDAAAQAAEAWAAEHPPMEGAYVTESAAGWFGEGSKLTLSYRYFDRGTGKTVILLHGYQDGEEGDLTAAPWWWDRGYSVLIPQQRGYQAPGETNRSPVTYGVYEEFDLYDLILAAGLAEETVIVHGKGSGAAAAILMAANESLSAAGLDGIAAESVYDELGSLQRDLLKKLFHLGDWFVGRFLRSRIRDNLGFEPDSVDIRAAAAHVSCPVLFVCGSQETLPGESRSRAVYDACTGRKQLVTVPGASYRALWLSEDCRAAAAAFFP
jgi:pimeloyl-ACP methyl ester carboxylesterase